MKKINLPFLLFITLLIIIFLEVLYIIDYIHYDRSKIKIHNCSMAYSCKIDKENEEVLNCKYIDSNGKEKEIKCNK